MNNRIGLAVAGVIAAIAIILVVIQSGNLSQAEGKLSSIQSTATAQQAAFVGQGTAAVATLSAASTQAADSANAAATSQANAAATAEAKALGDAANKAATAQAEALAAAANAASTMQAQALAAASEAAASAQAEALTDASNKAATAQASAVGAAQNAAATQQAQAEATLEAQATATLGAVVNAAATAQADAVKAAQSAAAVEQEKALATLEAQSTATLRASIAEASTAIAQIQDQAQSTQTVLETQITDLQAQVATAKAAQSSAQATVISPTTEANSVPSDWKRYVGKGVAIQLPNTYVGSELGSDPEALGKMLRSLGPDFAAAATLFEQNPDILSFIAVDVGSKSGVAASVIVVSVPMPVKFSLNTLLDATTSQLPRGSKVIEKSVVQVGEYEAGRMIVETQVGGIISTQLQFYIIQNDKLYLVGFTGMSGNFESQLPTFEQSMKTFEILAKPGI